MYFNSLAQKIKFLSHTYIWWSVSAILKKSKKVH